MEDQTAAAKKKRISVIVTGSSHDDQGLTVILPKLMKQLTALGLKVFYCDEREENQTLAQKAQGIQLLDSCICRTNLELPFVRAALSPPDATHAKPYFTHEALESLEPKVKAHYSYSDQQFQTWIESMYRFHAVAATVRLDQYLSNAKIPYQGLSQTTEEHAKTLRLLNESSQNMKLLEPKRIEHMTTVFFNQVLPKLPDGGVVICDLGALHTHRFAAHVLEKCEALGNNSAYDIKITLACCFSNYYPEEHRKFTFGEIQNMRQHDNASIVKRYETLPRLKAIELVEKNHGDDFESEELRKVFEDAAMFAKPPKFYFIPDVNESKRALIQSLSGTVIQERQNGIYVRLRSCELTADRRKALGIERSLITLTHGQENKLEQLKSQKEFITIEETCFPNKYLVTFPPNQLAFVEGIIKENKSSSQKTISPSQKGK